MAGYFEIGPYIITPWQLVVYSTLLSFGAAIVRRFRR